MLHAMLHGQLKFKREACRGCGPVVPAVRGRSSRSSFYACEEPPCRRLETSRPASRRRLSWPPIPEQVAASTQIGPSWLAEPLHSQAVQELQELPLAPKAFQGLPRPCGPAGVVRTATGPTRALASDRLQSTEYCVQYWRAATAAAEGAKGAKGVSRAPPVSLSLHSSADGRASADRPPPGCYLPLTHCPAAL